MTAASVRTAGEEWRANWTIVIAAMAGISMQIVDTFTIGFFVVPLETEFGWKRAQIMYSVTISAFIAVLFTPLVGMLIDRLGPRRVALPGVVLVAITYSMLSTVTGSLWHWAGLWSMIAICSLLVTTAVWTVGISRAFDRGRGLAISMTMAGSSVGSIGIPFVANFFIDTYGWRSAYVGVAAIWGTAAFLLVFFFFKEEKGASPIAAPTPVVDPSLEPAVPIAPLADQAYIPGVSVRDGLLSWNFFRIAVSTLLFTAIMSSFVMNMPPIFVWKGYGTDLAAVLMAVFGVSSLLGKFISGYLLDRIHGPNIGALAILLATASLTTILFMPHSATLAVVAIAVLGLGAGGQLGVISYVGTRYFGLRHFATLFGVIFSVMALASGIGPVAAGHTYDVTGSYELLLWISIPFTLVSAILFATLGAYPSFAAVPGED